VISYAQNLEDVLLNRLFPRKPQGFYIDVGAMDPVEGSVTKTFYDRGWCGINIEPDVKFYEKLTKERPRDINLNLALGEFDEERPFFVFETQGLSTFHSGFRDFFAERQYPWREERRRLRTMAQVCEEHVRTCVDFLKIDAEGWEGPILRGSDWKKFRPLVLVIEATEPYSHTPAWQEWEPYLACEAKYLFVYFDGLNRFYTRQENPELQAAFAYPPNVLDEYRVYETVRAEQRAREAKDETGRLAAEIDRLIGDVARQAAELERLSAQVSRGSAERAALEAERAALEQKCESMRQRAAELESEARENRHWAGRLSEMLASFDKTQVAK
jgi:FkbM family methyltransferase